MDKRKMKRRKKLIAGAAAYVASYMVILAVRHKLRNRRVPIRYGPIEARDRIRFNYLNNKIWKSDTISVFMIRLKRALFFKLCELMRERGLLCDTIHTCIEEQVVLFLHITGHSAKNRVVANNFTRSREPVSRYFGLVLHAIGELRAELIRPPSLETPAKITGNPRWDPFFQDCIGAIDGTHIRASVRKYAKGSSDALGTQVINIEDANACDEEVAASDNTGGASSATRKPKRPKLSNSNDDEIFSFMSTGLERLAQAIEKTGEVEEAIPKDLWKEMKMLPGFEKTQLLNYYAYLCENLAIARAFHELDDDEKVIFVARYINKTNPI